MERNGRKLKLIRGNMMRVVIQNLSLGRGQSQVKSEVSVTSRSFKQASIPPRGLEFIYPELSFTEYYSDFSLFKAIYDIEASRTSTCS